MMTYEKEQKQYTGPWVNNLKHGIGLELNLRTMIQRQGEWQEGKWLRWITANSAENKVQPKPKPSSKPKPTDYQDDDMKSSFVRNNMTFMANKKAHDKSSLRVSI
jgi:hypothetical protein